MTLALLVALFLKDLFQASKPVLAVETASGSEVVVTLPNMDELRQIAGLIAHAIDNPAAEFSTFVNQVNNTTNNHYGPVVNMNDGHHNTGISYGTPGGAQDETLRALVAELTRLLQELHQHLAPEQARTVEEALPALTPDRTALRERGLLLASVAQIAAAVGTVGQPVADVMGRLLALLGP
ncbi:hypothetical protein AB0D54_06590 [Streptomyces xanthophaeus]